jgi:hypothetical protein
MTENRLDAPESGKAARKISFTPPTESYVAAVELTTDAARASTTKNTVQLVKKRRFSTEGVVVPIPSNTSAADLDFVDTLVKGSFAELVLVKRRDINQVVVAKAFHHGTWRSEYLCLAELRVFQNVNSPWLIAFYGFIEVNI